MAVLLFIVITVLDVASAQAEDVISTFAGGGYANDDIPALQASLNFPTGLTLDKFGRVYFTDETSHTIRRVDRTTGIMTRIAGVGDAGYGGDGGPATDARLNLPIGIVIDNDLNLYVCEKANHRVRRIDGATGIITTFAGTGEGTYNGDGIPATQAALQIPVEVGLDSAGNV